MPSSTRIALAVIAAGMVLLGVMVFRFGPGFYRAVAGGTARRAGISPGSSNPFGVMQVFGKWVSLTFGILGIAGGITVAGMIVLGMLGVGPFK